MTAYLILVMTAQGLRAVLDDAGRLVAFQTASLAYAFIERLGESDVPALALERDQHQVADLLALNDLDARDFTLVEAQATDSDDAGRRTVDLAARVINTLQSAQ